MRVSILGAGPAGSTAALCLAEAGIDVELIDKTDFPREKPCGGGLFNPLQYYRDFPYVEDIAGKHLYTVLFRSGRNVAEYTSKQPLIKTCVRKEFDHFLLKKAVEAGARFRVCPKPANQRFVDQVSADPGSAGEKLPVEKPAGEVSIDARGALRAKDYPECGICLVHDFETVLDIDTVHIHYGFMGIKGYCWLYPKKGYANIGVGAYMPQRNIREVYERYIDFLNAEGTVSIREKPFSAKLLPFAPRRRFTTDGSILVGDAAGFVNTSTGEGIYFAMVSGKLAARAVIEKKPFSWYEGECRKSFGHYLKPTRFWWSRPLLEWAVEKAVKICGRDERFRAMLSENFFRLGKHDLTGRFLRHLFT